MNRWPDTMTEAVTLVLGTWRTLNDHAAHLYPHPTATFITAPASSSRTVSRRGRITVNSQRDLFSHYGRPLPKPYRFRSFATSVSKKARRSSGVMST